MESDGADEKLQLNSGLKNGTVYVFDADNKSIKERSEFRKNIWQIFPAVCASMLCFSFGIMLGWPSPTYPNLIESLHAKPTPFTITADQSAMAAGFLMIGNTISTPISATRKIPSKYGLVLASTLIVFGWMVMWQSSNLFWVLASRLLVGIGHGFGFGQLKLYISEICQAKLATVLLKTVNFYTLAGVIFAFALGPFVEFKQFCITSIILSVFVWFLAVFLPSTPRELLLSNKKKEAKRLVEFLSPHLDAQEELSRIKGTLEQSDPDLTFIQVLKDAELRGKFFLLMLAIFFQQFSGAPATVVYSQILFDRSNCPNAHFCALIYSLVFLASFVYATFCNEKQSKKYSLLFSSIGVSYMLTMNIVVIKEDMNKNLFQYATLVVMCFYIVFHTIGFGAVTFRLIPAMFPKGANKVMGHFAIMLNSMLALIVTKIFQVMVFKLELAVPFYMFLVVSNVAIMFVTVFIPKDPKINDNY